MSVGVVHGDGCTPGSRGHNPCWWLSRPPTLPSFFVREWWWCWCHRLLCHRHECLGIALWWYIGTDLAWNRVRIWVEFQIGVLWNPNLIVFKGGIQLCDTLQSMVVDCFLICFDWLACYIGWFDKVTSLPGYPTIIGLLFNNFLFLVYVVCLFVSWSIILYLAKFLIFQM